MHRCPKTNSCLIGVKMSKKPKEVEIKLPTETKKEIERRAKEAGLTVVEYLESVFLHIKTKSKKVD